MLGWMKTRFATGAMSPLSNSRLLFHVASGLAIVFWLFPFLSSLEASFFAPQDTTASEKTTPAAARNSMAVSPQVELINSELQKVWKEFQIQPSKAEDDGLWCRRAYLDVLGRIPTFRELQTFGKMPASERRSKLIQKLLNDETHTEEFAARWSNVWTNILIGRNGGMENNTLINRSGLEKYLRDCFARNYPYNRMVFDLVTATGATKPGVDGFNGATNFLIMKVNDDNGVQATAAVSKIFLGLQVQCTQCHDHPANQWSQKEFWQFNAFFRQARALRRFDKNARNAVDFCELIDQDFEGDNRRVQEADTVFLLRNGEAKVAYPVFVDGTSIPTSGYVNEVVRRQELGKLMLNSPYLDKMIVNRMWAHFMGCGFTKPMDDLGPHNPSSHPNLLEKLGEAFRENSYDLRLLMSWIMNSQAYQLSSRTTKANASDDPALGEMPKFSHYYARQMGPEEVYQSLVTATQADQLGSLEEQQRKRDEWLKQFVVAYGTDDGGEASTFNGSIPQSLMMFNGELIREATSISPGSWLDQIAKENGKTADKTNYLFVAGLGRKATKEELEAASMLLSARKGAVVEMLQDMWWAILNSNEFIIKH